ncbi:hypothetical protein BH09BAC2_BH09BAC2_19570 [soil metagenome]
MSLKLIVLLPFILLLKLHDYKGCSSTDKPQTNLPTPAEYDLNHPQIVNLPTKLNEISGIWYYPKDTSVFAIVDEAGILYKIFMHRNLLIKEWKFDKNRDFEDIVLHDSTFYILVSNGDLDILNFTGDSINQKKIAFEDASKKLNEFESLYYDENYKQLIMICKSCEGDSKKSISAWGYNIDSSVYTPGLFTIDVMSIAAKAEEEKFKFKPSASAINPITNDLYILSSVNHLLVVVDTNRTAKAVYKLDPRLYKQPEGITFTSTGDMLISNEQHDEGSANILIIKRKSSN